VYTPFSFIKTAHCSVKYMELSLSSLLVFPEW